ncbi:SfnB family sulfur acquisition oxidoreductase [Acetobacter oeni]|uniref:SfnB family sulfur acquisition oxidoreductase n=1 Tax=Acetobacter oeni TaxID=304077 RepID=A0A511XKR7_9PROT|nr:SfnB family sulfur acquisition oxidoreductase [Acetobacter oeni]MBB3883752.1 SfnB family sulfur acquisition oxidoreductase [Acetobacter oeni]NHO19900.1 SfnB family sulfur acquisition oxidoreductase [Acetobacter oeni]GBR10294.1 acyl-CoA dehydrogenase [Acetobacter oeni LMG 21952]GEN63508.1 SfnB family sulfur acquisition oxidoreductase [Acetobacter oeni]
MTRQIVVGGGEAVPPPSWPRQPASILRTADEALDAADKIASLAARDAVKRDREDLFPGAELDAFSASGLWGITVPAEWGGADLSYTATGRVIVTIAAVDSSLAQLAQNHLATIAAIRSAATEEQKADLFPLVLEGRRFGNAFSERGTKNVSDLRTSLVPAGDDVVLNGIKYYCTGALAADLIQIVAIDQNGLSQLAIADRNSPGLTVFNDWTAFGQRGTGSGKVLIEDVRVPVSRVIPVWKSYVPEKPFPDSAISQFIQAAIDAGIAQGALRETEQFIRTRTRPWVDSGLEKATEDPYLIQIIGSLHVRLSAALALLDNAGRIIDAAIRDPTPATVSQAQIAVAKAKILTTELAIDAADRLFELAGTAATDRSLGLDRYWRNARTHTLHDPVRWKYAIIGEYYLNDHLPPLHPWS